MKKLRILYVINSMEGGGAASPVPAILTVLRNCGAEVRLVSLLKKNGKGIAPIEEAGFPVHISPTGPRNHLGALNWIKQQARDFGATHIWTSLTRATLLGQWAGKHLGTPVISWQHNAFLKPWNERLLRWNASKSAIWVADSANVTELSLDRLNVPRERLITWPIFFADPTAPKARAWKAGEPVRMGSLGRLHPNKGYDVLIEALIMLHRNGWKPAHSFQVTIAGDGGDHAMLQAKLDGAGIANVELAGFTEEPRAFLADLHLYLQPSRREGFCIAAHEAMQAGLPLIVSSTGQIPHSVADGTMGRVVSVEDVGGLAQALADMMSYPEKLHSMGLSAREFVLETYSKARFEAIGSEIVDRLRSLPS